MQPISDFKDIEMNEYTKLPSGGYIIKMLKVEDNEQKNYFSIVYDIEEGDYKGFFQDDYHKDKDYTHTIICSYSANAKRSFKGFITSVEKSNNVFLQDKVVSGTLTGKDLEGLIVGAILSYEGYNKTNGGEGIRLSKFAGMRSVDVIRSGDFVVPETKPAKEPKSDDASAFSTAPADNPFGGFTQVKDEEVAFDDKDLSF